jgi:hypothetical protein
MADKRAQPLVAMKDDGSLAVCEPALQELSAIDAPIAVVAMVGPQRSGKSFILNCLADGPRFEVGPNVHACTKGIWMWAPPPGAGSEESVHTIFLDTEGLGAVKASQTTDLRTFGLSVLLSSYFIFNTQGKIDESAIKQLSFISQMSKAIAIRADGADEATDFEDAFPHLLWVLRDFSLSLQVDGGEMSPNEYLESSLRSERGISDEISARNRVRMLLTTFFSKRDCATLPRPVTDESELSQLGQAGSRTAFRPAFNEQLQALRKQVLDAAAERPKRLNGLTLRGPELARLVSCYVDALNSGQVPTVAHAWQAVQELQAQSALKKSLEHFKRDTATDSRGEPWGWPVESSELEQAIAEARQHAIDAMRKNVLNQSELTDGLTRLGVAMDEVAAALFKANQAAATAAVVSSLEQGWASTQKAVQSGELCGCDAVLSEWAALRRSVSNAGGDPEAISAAVAMFCTEVVLADVAAAGKAEVGRLSDELAAERKRRESTQSELIVMTEQQQVGLAEARAARDTQAGGLQERLDAAMAAQREEAHVSALQKMQWEKESMELKLKASYNEAEIGRLRETVTRVELERDALQQSLADVRAELATANEARAELVGKLAVLRPAGGGGAPSSVAAPPGSAPGRPGSPQGADGGGPPGGSTATTGLPSPNVASETAPSTAAGAGGAGAQGPVMTAEMLKAGRAGDATAQCVIGYCYAAGQGVRQHWAEALKWYRAAAEQGHPNAQYNLGTCYAKGRGVRLGVDVQTWDECWEKAVYWFSLAAEQGDAAAQCNLATCYLKGQGVEQDRQEAIRWYEQAAQRGDEKARRHLEALLGGS